jgi:hypothetical protein
MYRFTVVPDIIPASEEKCSTTSRFPLGTT